MVALEAPVELPPRASALAAWHRAKAGGAVDRAEGCRRPSRGELRANGATRGVNACTTARRHILRHWLASKLLWISLKERPPSRHAGVIVGESRSPPCHCVAGRKSRQPRLSLLAVASFTSEAATRPSEASILLRDGESCLVGGGERGCLRFVRALNLKLGIIHSH